MLRNLSRLTFIFATLLSFGFFSLFSPRFAHAQVIGTHLGQGDITAQVEIMDFLSQKVKSPEKFPVTLMIEVTNSRDQIKKLADKVKAVGFIPIVRINLVCAPAGISNGKATVEAVRDEFGDGVAIVWGNEINNETECKDLDVFATGFQNVRNLLAGRSGGIGPAALDFYHPNRAVDLLKLTDPNIQQNYTGAQVYFSNSYGCQGQTKDSCDPAATETHKQGYEELLKLGSNFYMTEFSLSPANRDDNAPDADLKKVVEFIETRAAETGAIAVTPLIRNVCNEDGDWLLFITGDQAKNSSGEAEVYTFTKSKVPIENCSSTNKDPYYLYPIPALYEEFGNEDEKKQALISQLNQQGYQAQCLSPEISINAVVNAIQDPSLYSQVFPNDILETEISYDVNFTDAKVPGWRLDGDFDLTVVNSLETLFGFRKEAENVLPNSSKKMEEAIVYRSLGLIEQCVQQSKTLDTVRTMCNKLENPDACALNSTIKVADAEFELFALFQEMNNRINTQMSTIQGMDREKARKKVCEAIQPKANEQVSVNEKNFRTALSKVPLFMSKAYRLGFLVMSIEQKNPEGEVSDLNPFRFMRKNDAGQFTKHDVRVFTFKIPDIGTNKDINSDIYYADALDITRNTILSKEQQDLLEENYRTLITAENIYTDTSNMPILCEAEKSPYCKLPGVQALIEYVNTYLRPQSLVKAPYLDEKLFIPETASTDELTSLAQVGISEYMPGKINQKEFKMLLTDPKFEECAVGPDELPYQEILEIFSSGEITEGSDGQIFSGENDLYEDAQKSGISQSFPSGTEGDPGPFSFLSQAKARKSNELAAAFTETNEENKIKIKSYLVVPQGYYLGATEDALAGRFLSTNQKKKMIESMKPNPINENAERSVSKFFAIDGLGQKIQETIVQGKTIVELGNPVNCVEPGAANINGRTTELGTTEDEQTEESEESQATGNPRTCNTIELAVKHAISPGNVMPRIHGGLLGEFYISMQKSLLALDSEDWEYMNSCQTIEELIKGTCQGGPIKNPTRLATANLELVGVAQCVDGSGSMTAGETAIHFASSRNPACNAFVSSDKYGSYAITPEGENILSLTEYLGSNFHYIPNWKNPDDLPFGNAKEFCEKLYSFAACTFPGALLQNPVNSDGQWDDAGTMTACEYVVEKAQEAGVSPRFAMAIWGEESGFSADQFRNAYAFGITSQEPLDLKAQVASFVGTVANGRYEKNPVHTTHAAGIDTDRENANAYLDFLEQYSDEKPGSNQFCTNKFFPGQVKTYYDFLNETTLRNNYPGARE
mgnify:CR=1 FL=1